MLYFITTIAVIGQQCTDTVGSLSHDSNIVTQGQTYILAGYTIPCSGTVVALGVLLSNKCNISDILSWYLEDNWNNGW